MVNPGLNVNRTFREQVEQCMFTKFDAIIQIFIKAKLLRNKARVLALILFYETRAEDIDYRVPKTVSHLLASRKAQLC